MRRHTLRQAGGVVYVCSYEHIRGQHKIQVVISGANAFEC
jgi:hypothetical protein